MGSRRNPYNNDGPGPSEEPEYASPEDYSPPEGRGGGPSGRSTPDVLSKAKNLFRPKSPKSQNDSKKAQKNLEESYGYFKDQYDKATTTEEKNKISAAAHRHYMKSKKTYKNSQEVVEATYVVYLDAIREKGVQDTEDNVDVTANLAAEFDFFFEQHKKSDDDKERDAAAAAANRYFTLQYKACKSETERAMASHAYQDFLDKRAAYVPPREPPKIPEPQQNPLQDRSAKVEFDFYLKNFSRAKTEEQRIAATSAAHDYFMELSKGAKTEADVAKLGKIYQAFLVEQQAELSEFRELESHRHDMRGASKTASASAAHSASKSSSSRSRRTSKKTTRTTSRSHHHGHHTHGANINIETKTMLVDKPETPPPPPSPPPPPMLDPKYFVRWLYFCFFFQLLFIFAIVLIFLFGGFAYCWVKFTWIGFIIMILLWIIFAVLVIALGLFAPKRKDFPYNVIWLVVLTIVLSVCLGLTAVYFNCIYFLVVLLGLMTIFILQFAFSWIPFGYSQSRTVFITLLGWLLCVICAIIFLSAAGLSESIPWLVSLLIILLIGVWIAYNIDMVIDNKFHKAVEEDWMFGLVCCYTDTLILTIHFCYMPFHPVPEIELPKKKKEDSESSESSDSDEDEEEKVEKVEKT